jgi:hypothetical protein
MVRSADPWASHPSIPPALGDSLLRHGATRYDGHGRAVPDCTSASRGGTERSLAPTSLAPTSLAPPPMTTLGRLRTASLARPPALPDRQPCATRRGLPLPIPLPFPFPDTTTSAGRLLVTTRRDAVRRARPSRARLHLGKPRWYRAEPCANSLGQPRTTTSLARPPALPDHQPAQRGMTNSPFPAPGSLFTSFRWPPPLRPWRPPLRTISREISLVTASKPSRKVATRSDPTRSGVYRSTAAPSAST